MLRSQILALCVALLCLAVTSPIVAERGSEPPLFAPGVDAFDPVDWLIQLTPTLTGSQLKTLSRLAACIHEFSLPEAVNAKCDKPNVKNAKMTMTVQLGMTSYSATNAEDWCEYEQIIQDGLNHVEQNPLAYMQPCLGAGQKKAGLAFVETESEGPTPLKSGRDNDFKVVLAALRRANKASHAFLNKIDQYIETCANTYEDFPINVQFDFSPYMAFQTQNFHTLCAVGKALVEMQPGTETNIFAQFYKNPIVELPAGGPQHTADQARESERRMSQLVRALLTIVSKSLSRFKTDTPSCVIRTNDGLAELSKDILAQFPIGVKLNLELSYPDVPSVSMEIGDSFIGCKMIEAFQHYLGTDFPAYDTENGAGKAELLQGQQKRRRRRNDDDDDDLFLLQAYLDETLALKSNAPVNMDDDDDDDDDDDALLEEALARMDADDDDDDDDDDDHDSENRQRNRVNQLKAHIEAAQENRFRQTSTKPNFSRINPGTLVRAIYRRSVAWAAEYLGRVPTTDYSSCNSVQDGTLQACIGYPPAPVDQDVAFCPTTAVGICRAMNVLRSMAANVKIGTGPPKSEPAGEKDL